jgi:hypothetical protein
MACNGRYWNATRAHEKALAEYDPLDPETSRPEPPGHDIVWGWGDPVWCWDCQALIARQLEQLDTLAALRGSRGDGFGEAPGDEEKPGKRGKKSEVPSPSAAADDRLDLHAALSGWEAGWRELNGWDPAPYRGELARAETEVTAWLGKHLRGINGILASAMGKDFGREVLSWHARLSRAEKAGVKTLRLPLRCPRCHILSLTWEEGSDRVQCGDDVCGLVMSRDQYDAAVDHLHSMAVAGKYEHLPEAEKGAALRGPCRRSTNGNADLQERPRAARLAPGRLLEDLGRAPVGQPGLPAGLVDIARR